MDALPSPSELHFIIVRETSRIQIIIIMMIIMIIINKNKKL